MALPMSALDEPLQILNHHPDPIIRIDLKDGMLYANAAASALFAAMNMKDEYLNRLKIISIARKTVQKKVCEQIEIHTKQGDFLITLSPIVETAQVDIYFRNISQWNKTKHYFDVQAGFAHALLKAITVEDVCWSIVKQAIAELDYEDCVVYLLEEDGVHLRQVAAHGPKNPKETEIARPINIRVGEGIVGSVAQKRRGEIVDNVNIDERYIVDDQKRNSEIAVPICDESGTIGVIDSESSHIGFYSHEDLSLLRAIASMAAVKIQRIRSMENVMIKRTQIKSIVDNAFGAIYIRRAGRFEMVNRVFCELTGYSEKEMTSPRFNIKNLIHHLEEEGKEALAARKQGDRSRKSYQLDIKSRDGSIRRLTVNTVILEDHKGPYTLGIALDISDVLQAERSLQALNEQLSEKNDDLKQFAHLASHNLRAPVSNMIGLLDIYQASEDSNPQNARVILALKKAVDDLNTTLTEMHDVLKSRNIEHKLGMVDLRSVYRKILAMLKDEIDKSGIDIQIDFAVKRLRYAKPHLENFFLNMISNAIKYRSPDRPAKLLIKSRKSESYVHLVFEDNGLGIDLERYGKDLFGMYKSFHHHPNSRGVGLYLVKSQLSSLEGRVEVKSTVGKGSTFELMLKNQ